MHSPQHFQTAIYDAHFNDDTSAASKLIVPYGLSEEQRLNIYRNNTFITLTDALSKTYPVINKLVGDDFFAFAAQEFIKKSPPQPGPLFEYGENFPNFISKFEPASSLAYLADVAYLEWARNISYHAADVPPITLTTISTIPEGDLTKLCFEIHPSCRMITSKFPIDSIWMANQPDGELKEIDLEKSASLLIIRPYEQVNLHVIEPGTVSFLKSLNIGQNLEEAYSASTTLNPEFDPAEAMIELISFGVFTAVDTDHST